MRIQDAVLVPADNIIITADKRTVHVVRMDSRPTR